MANDARPPIKLYELITSNASVQEVSEYLCKYDSKSRTTIINTHLIHLNDRTAVHVTAAMNHAPLLRLLLEHGGKCENFQKHYVVS